jgi:hypothetical protein
MMRAGALSRAGSTARSAAHGYNWLAGIWLAGVEGALDQRDRIPDRRMDRAAGCRSLPLE